MEGTFWRGLNRAAAPLVTLLFVFGSDHHFGTCPIGRARSLERGCNGIAGSSAHRPASHAGSGATLADKTRGRRQEPVADFLSSLKANDAAFQVIVGQSRLLTTKGDIA